MSISILKPCPEHGPRGCVVCEFCGHDQMPHVENESGFMKYGWESWHSGGMSHRVKAYDSYRAALESIEEAMGMNGAGLSIVERAACVIERFDELKKYHEGGLST